MVVEVGLLLGCNTTVAWAMRPKRTMPLLLLKEDDDLLRQDFVDFDVGCRSTRTDGSLDDFELVDAPQQQVKASLRIALAVNLAAEVAVFVQHFRGHHRHRLPDRNLRTNRCLLHANFHRDARKGRRRIALLLLLCVLLWL